MPHIDYAVKDRKAVAQLRYQVRRFIRQMRECGTPESDIDRISCELESAVNVASGSVDFDDDGSRIED